MENKFDEDKLAKYLLGIFIATTIAFIIGKFIGYFDFLSWWYIIVPFIINIIGALVNYLDWEPNNRFMFYTIYAIFSILRHAILRIIIFSPILYSVFTSYRILVKYGNGNLKIRLISVAVGFLTYSITIILAGKRPRME